jgi:pantoate--beta-alanine ligase
MKIVRTIRELKMELKMLRRDSPEALSALVPTMGFLHDGHLSLFAKARELAGITMAHIFVNPLQFNNPDDFENYPNSIERDIDLCGKSGLSLLFIPSHEEIYPNGTPSIHLSMPDLTKNLCGAGRPGHFEGVLYIIARLFNLFQPDIAIFGKKDYQQYAIIKKMGEELSFPVEIRGEETVRESDGLAMSSRNARLSERGREQAPLIYRALRVVEREMVAGNRDPGVLEEIGKDIILSGSVNRIEYLSIADPDSLELIVKNEDLAKMARVIIATAVVCDGIRLIDNIEVDL